MLNRLESPSLSYVFRPEEVMRMRRTIKKLQMVSYGGTKLKPSHGDVGSSFRRSPERKQEHIAAVFNRAAAELRAARAHIQEAMSGESIDITPEEVKQEPIVWAGVYPQYLICIVATEGVLVFDELVPQSRQVGQGLSFG